MKNLEYCKCIITSCEYGCTYGEDWNRLCESCKVDFDHDDMDKEVYDFVMCESCKVNEADGKWFMNNVAKGE